MADEFTEVTKQSYGKGVINSFIAGILGVILFIASFVVLWMNEGRVNWAKVAKDSVAVSPEKAAPAYEGKFVSVSGNLKTTEKTGDGRVLKSDNYLLLERRPEMFAWVERSESKTQTKTGGEQITTTKYTYEKKWASTPAETSEFKKQEGHTNPKMSVTGGSYRPDKMKIGVYNVRGGEIQLPAPEEIELASKMIRQSSKGKLRNGYVYIGKGSIDEPKLGDIRIKFYAVKSGAEVTVFGKAQSGSLAPHIYRDKEKFYRAVTGSRDEAIASLATEYKMLLWVFRLIGFLIMSFGLSLAFDPIATVLRVLPPAQSVSRFILGFISLAVSLVLSTVTIVIAAIANNIIALFIAIAVIAGLSVLFGRKKKVKPAEAPSNGQ